jgi:FKBP-type peptidyl-prolyl cis-trans isomerase 2
MSQAKNGDKVKVHYTARLENGNLVFSSRDSDPAEFIVGNEDVLPKIEKGITGMKVGETKTFTISPEEAYGSRLDDLVIDIKRSDFPQDITPAVGQQLKLKLQDGNQIDVTIIAMEEDKITLDANHPLAGETLLFDLELIEIV